MNAPAVRIRKPVREQVSKEEWQARIDLTACYRLMPGVRRRCGLLEWPALLRKLDRIDTSYKN